MPKSQFIDPSVMRAPGFVHFEDIPVNRYNKTIAEEKANRATEFARESGFPLLFTTEPEE